MSDAGQVRQAADHFQPSNDGGLTGEVAVGTVVPPQAVPPTIDWAPLSVPLENLGNKLDALRGDVQAATKAPPPAPPSADDLNAMTNAELVPHIAKLVAEVIDQRFSAISEPLQNAARTAVSTAEQTKLGIVIDRMKTEHKDFDDWRPEMRSLAEQHPTLTIPQLYMLARSSNADKMKELEAKYNPPPPPRRQTFGGLLPDGSLPSAQTSIKPLSREEAGRKAYEEVQLRHADVLRALDDHTI